MKRQYNFLWGLLLLPFIATIISCTNERRALLEEEDQPITLQINYSATTEAEENPLRAAITPYEEYKVHNLFIFLVDGSGNIVDRKFFNYDELKNKNEYNGSSDANYLNTTKGSVQMTTTPGNKKVYAVANVANGISSLLDISKTTLSNENSIKTESHLKNLFAKLNKETLSRINGRLLMSGVSSMIPLSSSQKSIDIDLIRVTAKVTFTIKGGPGVTFTPQTWQVYRVPKKVSVFPNTDMNGGVNGNNDFFDAATPRVFEGDAAGGEAANSFTYYQLENLKPAKGTPTSRKDRELQEKHSQGNGKVDNGTWVNAPDNGTYVVLKGRYEKTESDGQVTSAQVRYVIHLGYVNQAATDYNCKRNTHYQYTVTVNGVEDIIVEAKETNPNKEQDTGAEGKVTRGPQKYVFDSHYVQFVIRFEQEALREALNKATTNRKLDAKKLYKVDTPFGANDIGWVEFVRNTNKTKLNEIQAYPSNKNLRENVEEMFERLKRENANTHFYKDISDGKKYVYYTVFVNEYYYEDKNFWEFVNKPDRSMILTVGGKNHISPDGQSHYSDTQYGIWQKSIKTGYPVGSSQAIGFETMDESYGTPFEEDDFLNNDYYRYDWLGINASNSAIPKGNSKDDGWFNFVMSLDLTEYRGVLGQNYWNIPRDEDKWKTNKAVTKWSNYVDLNQIVLQENNGDGWGTYTLVKNGSQGKKKEGVLPSYNRARYACLSRNRDLNGNGYIDMDEVRWYMPAIEQLASIWQVSGRINREDQMYREPSFYSNLGRPRHVFYLTSTLDPWKSNVVKQYKRNNVFILWAGQGASVSTLGQSLSWVSSVDRSKYYNRCVRTLDSQHRHNAKVGIPSTYNSYTRVIKVLDNVTIDQDNYRDVNLNYLTGEYPPHSERSPFNRPASSFQVARRLCKEPRLSGVSWLERNNKDWGCAAYYETSADKGTWRVPNQREVQLMSQYDLIGTYQPGDYAPEQWESHKGKPIRIWSSTYFSNTPGTNEDNLERAYIGTDDGVALQRQVNHYDKEYREKQDEEDYYKTKVRFKLRCVRDYRN